MRCDCAREKEECKTVVVEECDEIRPGDDFDVLVLETGCPGGVCVFPDLPFLKKRHAEKCENGDCQRKRQVASPLCQGEDCSFDQEFSVFNPDPLTVEGIRLRESKGLNQPVQPARAVGPEILLGLVPQDDLQNFGFVPQSVQQTSGTILPQTQFQATPLNIPVQPLNLPPTQQLPIVEQKEPLQQSTPILPKAPIVPELPRSQFSGVQNGFPADNLVPFIGPVPFPTTVPLTAPPDTLPLRNFPQVEPLNLVTLGDIPPPTSEPLPQILQDHPLPDPHFDDAQFFSFLVANNFTLEGQGLHPCQEVCHVVHEEVCHHDHGRKEVVCEEHNETMADKVIKTKCEIHMVEDCSKEKCPEYLNDCALVEDVICKIVEKIKYERKCKKVEKKCKYVEEKLCDGFVPVRGFHLDRKSVPLKVG